MVQVVPEQKESWLAMSEKPPLPTRMSLVVLSEARWTW
jgi:hypothetical protein